MPAPLVKSFAKKTGKSVQEVEKLWDKAKEAITKKFPDAKEDKFFALVTGLLKKMLGIKEAATFSTPTANIAQFAPKLGTIQRRAEIPKKKKKKNIKERLEDFLKEGKKAKSKFESLKANKVILTDEERKQCLTKKAVWHHGPNGEETPAVWKSVNRLGEVTYVTATHRAYNTAPTLKGAIERYHSFIKSTA